MYCTVLKWTVWGLVLYILYHQGSVRSGHKRGSDCYRSEALVSTEVRVKVVNIRSSSSVYVCVCQTLTISLLNVVESNGMILSLEKTAGRR